jgi:aminoglycoside 6'-N-acetyltransferase I
MAWTIRRAEPSDAAAWERLRQELWPAAPGEHAGEIEAYFAGRERLLNEVLIALNEGGETIGFLELSLRSHAESCSSSPVGYLEGWFVESNYRGRGVGRALVEAGERWAREQGCSEMASDTNLENENSAAAHAVLGFEEVDRIICFRKTLAAG